MILLFSKQKLMPKVPRYCWNIHVLQLKSDKKSYIEITSLSYSVEGTSYERKQLPSERVSTQKDESVLCNSVAWNSHERESNPFLLFSGQMLYLLSYMTLMISWSLDLALVDDIIIYHLISINIT